MIVVLAMAVALATASDASQAGASTAATSATGSASQPTSTPKPPANDPNKVICKNEPVTGSRFTQRTCLTRAQWDEQTREAERLSQVTSQHAGMGQAPTSAFGN